MNPSNPMNSSSTINPTSFLLTLGIISGIAVLYFDTFVRFVKNLFTYENSHGLLILGVSLYLIWEKRDLLRRLPVQPNLIFGSLLTVFGCFIFLSGKLSGTQLLQQISLVVTLLGAIWLVLGDRFFRALLVPVGYIIFMFGLFEEIFGSISIYLQSITAWIAFHLLNLTGWPIFLKGQIIELPHISLEVARACNGINHIIALVALAVPLAIMTQRTLTRKMSLILISFLVGIFANGLRVALIGVWSYYNKGGPVHGPFDTLYVSFIFFFGMGLLFIISRFLAKPFHTEGKSQGVSGTELTRNPKKILLTATLCNSNNPRNSTKPSNSQNGCKQQNAMRYALPVLRSPSTWAKDGCTMRDSAKVNSQPVTRNNLISLSFSICMLILVSSIFFSYFYKPKPVMLAKPLEEFPMTVEGWTGKDVSNLDADIFKDFSAVNELKRVYSNHSMSETKLYVGYFPIQQQSKKAIDYRLGWLHDHPETIRISVSGEEIAIMKATWQGRRIPKTVYFWLNMNGRKILDPYRAKLATTLDAFTKRRNNGAIILIIVDLPQSENDGEHLQFLQAVYPLIQNHLNTLNELYE